MKTEQDTFDALRRISFESLIERCPYECRMIERNEYLAIAEELSLRKAQKRTRVLYRLIFGKSDILFKTSIPREDINDLYKDSFAGTGWSPAEYGEAVYKETYQKIEYNREIETKKNRLVILLYLISILLSILSGSILPTTIWVHIGLLPIIIGITMGAIVAQVVKRFNGMKKDVRVLI